MRRRDFITGIAGSAAAWPLAARAQQGVPPRRIGIIFPTVADDPVFQAWYAAFLQALALLGWIIGSNLRIQTRWATANPAEIRQGISELLAFAPDIIVAYGASTVGPMLQATPTIPIVFPVVGDPVPPVLLTA